VEGIDRFCGLSKMRMTHQRGGRREEYKGSESGRRQIGRRRGVGSGGVSDLDLECDQAGKRRGVVSGASLL
jgi:hypothetical protein